MSPAMANDTSPVTNNKNDDMRGESTNNVQEPPKINSQKDGMQNAISKSSSNNISSNEGSHDNENPVSTAINHGVETQTINKSQSGGQDDGSPATTAINNGAEAQASSESQSESHDVGSPAATANIDERKMQTTSQSQVEGNTNSGKSHSF